jgi:hypothetical protein
VRVSSFSPNNGTTYPYYSPRTLARAHAEHKRLASISVYKRSMSPNPRARGQVPSALLRTSLMSTPRHEVCAHLPTFSRLFFRQARTCRGQNFGEHRTGRYGAARTPPLIWPENVSRLNGAFGWSLPHGHAHDALPAVLGADSLALPLCFVHWT